MIRMKMVGGNCCTFLFGRRAGAFVKVAIVWGDFFSMGEIVAIPSEVRRYY
jgi:hypothetical protein